MQLRWDPKIMAAEAFGTAVLVLGGVGTAVIAGGVVGGTLGVALGFGLSLLIMVYAIGNISGCHINPAVTVGFLMAKRMHIEDAVQYWVAQFIGAAIGSIVLFVIASGRDGFTSTDPGAFGQNGYGDFSPGGYNLGAAIVVEVLLTALLIFVVLSTTHSKFVLPAVGITVGMTLALIHLISIPVDNTSVNPARSFASALFGGADAWAQIWVFFIFPVLGGALGAVTWAFINDEADTSGLGSSS